MYPTPHADVSPAATCHSAINISYAATRLRWMWGDECTYGIGGYAHLAHRLCSGAAMRLCWTFGRHYAACWMEGGIKKMRCVVIDTSH